MTFTSKNSGDGIRFELVRQSSTKSDFTLNQHFARHADKSGLRQSYISATSSPDPSTQNGAVLVNAQNSLIAADCNRLPAGVNPNSFRLTRPQKYDFMVHAESATVLRGLKNHLTPGDLSGHTLYVIWYACCDCARTIIESGVSRVVGHWDAHHFMMVKGQPKWRDSVRTGLEMLIEAGISCDWYAGPIDAPSVLMNGMRFDPNAI